LGVYFRGVALAKENPHRDDYIQALKKADNGDYEDLIKLQGNML